MKPDTQKLSLWQRRLSEDSLAFAAETAKMDTRERLYRGDDRVKPMTAGDRALRAPHVRNICAEMIESLVSSAIPMPKVTARRRKDERLAKIIEDMLRNELDRLPFETINDMMERTVPIQGGAAFLVEWDNRQRTHDTVGELSVSVVHPKQLVPQSGVYTDIGDMDYVILRMPQTKGHIKEKYGIDVSGEGEEAPEVKGVDDGPEDTLVTRNIAYYRNQSGGIGVFSWVNNTILEDLDDYQARRLRCGEAGQRRTAPADYEEVYAPIPRSDGTVIPGATWRFEIGEDGTPAAVEVPTRIPYYKPDIYPVILMKNVSVFGRLLGDSDIDKLASYQNATNRLETKIADKLLKSGSYITLPPEARIKYDAEDMKVIRLENVADKAMIDVYDLQGNVAADLSYLAQIYEEAKQVIGVTDAYLGRSDPTATSGKAKEFAAAQSAGRMESKRVMKEAAYARLFEAMFKFKLAYADEPRPVVARDDRGNAAYEAFNRYDFLEKDEAGEWCWNDRFLFSCDRSEALAGNREALWQETRNNLSSGAFGDPKELDTLILFWQKMALLHYPGAEDTKDYLERKQQMQQLQAQMQAQAQQMAQIRGAVARGVDADTAAQVLAQAKQDAAADAARIRGNLSNAQSE